MSLNANDSDEVMNEINMTPLVDIMLVLLIIFIITLPVLQHTVKVDLPRAASQPDRPQPSTLQLSVDAQGRYTLGQQLIEPDALEAALREQALQEPQPQLAILGDRQVAYEHVAWALAAAHRAGLSKLGFVSDGRRP